MSTIATKIKQLREARDLSQQSLGLQIGTHQSRISKWEDGVGAPKPPDLYAMSLVFGVSLEYLCNDEADVPDDVRATIRERFVATLDDPTKQAFALVDILGPREAIKRMISAPQADTPAPEKGGPDAPKGGLIYHNLSTTQIPTRKPGRAFDERQKRGSGNGSSAKAGAVR